MKEILIFVVFIGSFLLGMNYQEVRKLRRSNKMLNELSYRQSCEFKEYQLKHH